MSFAQDAIDTVGQFFKNKAIMLGIAGTLLTGAVFGQQAKSDTTVKPQKNKMTLSKKVDETKPLNADTIFYPSAKADATNTASSKTKTAVEKPKKFKMRNDNGYDLLHFGAKYNSKAIWNDGTQLTWGGETSLPWKPGSFMHRFTSVEADLTLRNKKIDWNYDYTTPFGSGSGRRYFRPTEVGINWKIGPKLGIASKRNPNFNKVLFYPHAYVGGSFGMGSNNNLINDLSPRVGVGADLLVGRIPIYKNIGGHYEKSGPSLAFKFTGGAQHQWYNNRTFTSAAASVIFPPNGGPSPRTTFYAGASLALNF